MTEERWCSKKTVTKIKMMMYILWQKQDVKNSYGNKMARKTSANKLARTRQKEIMKKDDGPKMAGKSKKKDRQKMAGKVKDGIQNNVAGNTGDSMLVIEEG